MDDKSKNSHLFKYQIEKQLNDFNNRPEFLYRLNRWRFDNIRRIPGNFSIGYLTKGWIVKGFVAYSLFYILIKRKPVTSYWNREGYYSYDPDHHTYKSDTLNVLRNNNRLY